MFNTGIPLVDNVLTLVVGICAALILVLLISKSTLAFAKGKIVQIAVIVVVGLVLLGLSNHANEVKNIGNDTGSGIVGILGK